MDVLHVLVVDDEPRMRQGMARALADFRVDMPDFEKAVVLAVRQAESGEQALAAIDEHPVDVLLLDYKLPGLQGLDVLEAVADRDLVTIMVTAYASIETAVSATKQGAFDFLPKPFTPRELQAAVTKAAHHVLVQRHARDLQKERRQMRFRLISVVAHELKAPLGAIENYLRLLLDDSLGLAGERRRHMLDRSLVRLTGMRKLIRDLLDLTRIESGQRARSLEQADLAALARGCLDNLGEGVDAAGMDLAFEGPESLPFRCDPEEMRIILDNLLSNAVKYNRPGGSVTLSIAREGKAAVLSVTDTGIGMTGEEQGRLFGEFVRIRNEKTRSITGSGLGLSIVRRLASLYQGSVAVESEPGRGSTFTVTLRPATDEKDEAGVGRNDSG